jgi:hypothetical protein
VNLGILDLEETMIAESLRLALNVKVRGAQLDIMFRNKGVEAVHVWDRYDR